VYIYTYIIYVTPPCGPWGWFGHPMDKPSNIF
jgi:hypothetical protein